MLEYNPPAHGTWNIVHIGMQIPDSHQVYVCAINCMRGVTMTAFEMGAEDRFSCVTFDEEDLFKDNLETVTIEGTAEAIESLEKRPRSVLLFTVCTHAFLGTDLGKVYGELRKRFPDIDFCRCYMDPIMQKNGPSPEMKLRYAMFSNLKPLEVRKKTAALLGIDMKATAENSDIVKFLTDNGWEIRQLPDCRDYDEFLKLGESELFISTLPTGKDAIRRTAERLGRKFIYMPMSYSSGKIRESMRELAELTGLEYDPQIYEKEASDAVKSLYNVIGSREIAIDYSAAPEIFSLAEFLLENAFNLNYIYADTAAEHEKEIMERIKSGSKVKILPIIAPEQRMAERKKTDILAIGQKAAWFSNTEHFVNIIENGGFFGFRGITALAELMKEAYNTEKDTADIIPRKAVGLCSCVPGNI